MSLKAVSVREYATAYLRRGQRTGDLILGKFRPLLILQAMGEWHERGRPSDDVRMVMSEDVADEFVTAFEPWRESPKKPRSWRDLVLGPGGGPTAPRFCIGSQALGIESYWVDRSLPSGTALLEPPDVRRSA